MCNRETVLHWAHQMLCFHQNATYTRSFPSGYQVLCRGLLVTMITCLTSSAMPRENAKVALQCLCGTSEFCVEIISLFSCHLGSGCWHVV